MAIIPQYNAGNPATSQAPAMEQERGGVRVDARGELAALGELANNLARGNRPQQAISADLGTGFFRGVDAIGDGVRQVGATIFGIRERVAEAKNDADEGAAQIAMEQEALAFEKAKQTLQPHQWEADWASRMTKFGDNYMTGRDLSPAAKERITQRMNAFASRQAVNVGVEAVSVQTQLGKKAKLFDLERAIEAQDPAAVKMISQGMVDRGYIFEDEKEIIEFRALDAIDSKQVETALMRADTMAMQGDYVGAREQIANAQFKSADEKANKLAEFDTKTAVDIIETAYGNRLDGGEDPEAIKAELLEKDKDGNYKSHPELSASSRARILAPIYDAANKEYAAAVEGADGLIEKGIIKNVSQLSKYFDGKKVDEITRLTLLKKLDGEKVDTLEAVMKLQADAANYDPSKDTPGKEVLRSQASIIKLTLGDDPRAAEILGTLEKRSQGKPITLAESIYGQKVKEITAVRDAAADYQIQASGLKVEERDGKKVFVDYSQEPDASDPDRFETETGSLWWKGKKAGRIISVSQEDRVKLENALTPDRNGFDGDKLSKIYVTDVKKKAAADMETAKVINGLSERLKSGELNESNLDDEYKKVTAPLKEKAAAAKLDSDIFGEISLPSGGGLNDTGSSGMFPADLNSWIMSDDAAKLIGE